MLYSALASGRSVALNSDVTVLWRWLGGVAQWKARLSRQEVPRSSRGATRPLNIPPGHTRIPIAMEEKTEARLVAEVLAGSGEAFASLVQRYQEYAYGVAVGLLTDFELARDVVQEAFMAAYRDLGKLKEPERFGGWLHGIVRHMSFRALRDLDRVRGLTEELRKADFAPAPSRRPDETAEDEEQRRIVSEALNRLSERNREVVGLHYVDGLSYADIAGFLHVTETTVQGRLQRARAQLREELTVVEEAFERKELPEDFAAEITRLLEAVAAPRTRPPGKVNIGRLEDGHVLVRQSRKKDRGRAVRRLQEIGAPAVDPLCEALEDPRGAVRQVALRALCLLGDARAQRPVVRLLTGEDPWTCWKVLVDGHVLSIPGVQDALVQIAQEGKSATTRHARVAPGMALQALGHAEYSPELVETIAGIFRDLAGYHRQLRGSALRALCHLDKNSALDWLTRGLSDTDNGVRSSAAFEAISRGLLPPLQVCLKALKDPGGWWGKMCYAILVMGHGGDGVKALDDILESGSGSERCAAAMALAKSGSQGAFDVLTQELQGSPAGPKAMKFQRSISRTIARSFGDLIVDWVAEDGEQRASFPGVMWTLARSRKLPQQGAPVGDMIEAMTLEAPPSIRQAAVRLLVRQRGAAYLPQLRQLLAAGRPHKVAREAFWQMHRLGDQAMSTATEMLDSEHWTERKAAVCLLRRWGKLTPEQKARAEADEHIAVRHSASMYVKYAG